MSMIAKGAEDAPFIVNYTGHHYFQNLYLTPPLIIPCSPKPNSAKARTLRLPASTPTSDAWKLGNKA